MRIEYFHVDAFTDRAFSGNPAGVCLLEKPLAESMMQSIAFENHVSETAFVIAGPAGYRIRWFTPQAEVDLCGHATLATAHVLMNHKGYKSDKLEFQSATDRLSVEKAGDWLYLDFPARPPSACATPPSLLKAFKLAPLEVMASVRDYMVVLADEAAVRDMDPYMDDWKCLDKAGIIITAAGKECDFVSRYFAPGLGVAEDPVTGSSHCTLIPYWARKLGRSELQARQLSQRGGRLICRDMGERVKIGGRAVTYSQGWIEI